MNTNWKNYIETNPKIMFGKPVIIGSRIPVDLILEKLSCGETIDQLLKSYPSIGKESIYAIDKIQCKEICKQLEIPKTK